ncbi:MAG: 3'-5' exonuclease [Clostridia bacterium]|nr:3'-5' exonuclease [Clostridia bacterium]
MSVVFVDLEMKPIAKEWPKEKKLYSMETLQFGAVKLEGGTETDTFCRVVRPAFGPVPPRYEALTGITNAVAEAADPYAEVLADFIAWCADAEAVYAWSTSDMAQLRRDAGLHPEAPALDPLVKVWGDYQKIFTSKLGLHRELSLKQALEIVDLPFEGHMHDALWDSRNTAALYRLSLDEARWKQATAHLKKTVNNDAPVTFSLASLFAGLDLGEDK